MRDSLDGFPSEKVSAPSVVMIRHEGTAVMGVVGLREKINPETRINDES